MAGAPAGHEAAATAIDMPSQGLAAAASRLVRAAVQVIEVITVLALFGQLVLLTADVVARATVGYYFPSTADISNFTMAIMTFGGAVIAADRGAHVTLTAIVDLLPAGPRTFVKLMAAWLVIVTSAMLAWYSVPLLIQRIDQPTPILAWPEAVFLVPLTIGLIVVAARSLTGLIPHGPRLALLSAIPVALVFAFVLTVIDNFGSWTDSSDAITFQLGAFLILLFGGVPVAFALALASIIYLHFSGIATPVAAVINMSQGATNFLLLAIPFFVLAGALMAEGGLSRRLAHCLRLLVGRVYGGLHEVLVIASFIFSGLSGAKIADIVAVGGPLKKMLDEQGYPPEQSAAVLAASAAAGETIPPSIAMLVLGSVTSISIAALFVGGVIPAAIISLMLMGAVYIRARRMGLRHMTRSTPRQKAVAIWYALPAFLIPAVIVGSIAGGFATPTEVSAIAVVACLVFSVVYREMSWRRFGQILVESAALSGMVLLLVSAATSFSWSLTIGDLPNQIGLWLREFTGGPILFLVITVILLIVMGALLEGLPAIIIFGPLLLPAAVRLGIDPLHFGVVLIVSMGIGAFSPPMGAGLYVAAAVVGARSDAANRAMLSYIFILFLAACVIAFVPALTMVLPRTFGMVH